MARTLRASPSVLRIGHPPVRPQAGEQADGADTPRRQINFPLRSAAHPRPRWALLGNSMKTDVTFTLRWHFEAKNLALQNALRLRCPLSVEQSKALRLYYSEYLAHLVSATDLLLEKESLYVNRDVAFS